jgi:hypothetical protein
MSWLLWYSQIIGALLRKAPEPQHFLTIGKVVQVYWWPGPVVQVYYKNQRFFAQQKVIKKARN